MYTFPVDEEILRRKAERLQGFARMGGFVVSPEVARQAVLDAEENVGTQKSLLQTLTEVRASRPSSAGE